MPKRDLIRRIDLRPQGASGGLGSGSSVIAGKGLYGGSTVHVGEGPGIDVTEDAVGIGGDSILLYHGNGDPASEYDASATGLTAALSAAVTGDAVLLPPAIIGETTDSFTVPAGVVLSGQGALLGIIAGDLDVYGYISYMVVWGQITFYDNGMAWTGAHVAQLGVSVGETLNSIQKMIDSFIPIADVDNRCAVFLMPGLWEEQVTMRPFIDLIGLGKHAVHLQYASSEGAIILADNCQIENILIEGTATEGDIAILGTNVSGVHIRNVDILQPIGSSYRSSGIAIGGNTWSTLFIEHCVINVYSQTGGGIALAGNGQNIDCTINDVFVDTWDATTGGCIGLSNVTDVQIRNSHLRTSAAGFCLAVADADSEVEVHNTVMEGGASSLENPDGATVRLMNCSIDSASGSARGWAYNRTTDALAVSDGSYVAALVHDGLDLPEHGSAPGTPAANRVAVYAAADGHVYAKDDAGTVFDLSGGRTLIAELTPTGTGTATFGASGTLPQTYKSLVMEYAIRGAQAATYVWLSCYLNNDTTATNYRATLVYGYGASYVAAGGGDNAIVSAVAAANAPSGSAGVGVIEIPMYTLGHNKQILTRSGYRDAAAGNGEFAMNGAAEWENVAAVNRIDLVLSAGNYAAGSTIRLYGMW
jgi:hypothetical protein